MGPQSCGNNGNQHLGHSLHHAGLGENPQEHTGCQEDHGHGQSGGSVHLNGTSLVFGGMEVGNQGHGQTEHESTVQRNLGEAQEADNEQGQDAVEPDHLGTAHEFSIFSGQVIVSGFVFVVVRQLSRFAGRIQTSSTAFFHNPHVSGEYQQDDQTNALQGQQLLPQSVYVSIQHYAGTGYRTAPGQQVHDGHGRADDAHQHHRTHVELFVDGEHGGDGDQQGGSQSAVQVGNNSDAGGGHRNHHNVGTGFFHQPVHHGIKQTHITHHGEVNDGEDEQYSRRPGLAHPGFYKAKDFRRGEPADESRNHRYHHKQRYRVGFTADQSGHDNHNHQETNNAQEHNAFPPLNGFLPPERAGIRERMKDESFSLRHHGNI